MMFRRILAVGDVHGHMDALHALWKKIEFDDKQDMLVFLGDYIDRGPAPVEVLRFVREQVERHAHVHALCGNHEAMMLGYIDAYGLGRTLRGHFDIWLMNGGKGTKKQLAALPAAEAEELVSFVRKRPLCHRVQHDGQRILFVHAGVHPTRKERTAEDMLWIREPFLDHYRGSELVVVGHTPTQSIGGRGMGGEVERLIRDGEERSYVTERLARAVSCLGEKHAAHRVAEKIIALARRA